MPLLDHFHPPLSMERPWEGIHSTWASTIATQLNQDQLPAEYFAMPLALEESYQATCAALRSRV